MNKLAAIVIPVYLVLILGMILYNGRRVKNFKDFAIGGGKLPWFVVMGTIMAAVIGGGVMMGYVGSFYQNGVMFFWMCLGLFVSWICMTFLISARVRRLDMYTIADILNRRYGKNARLICGIINMLIGIAVGYAMLASFSALLSGYVGIPIQIARIIGAVLFATAATWGGLTGIAYTDVIQAGIILVGAFTVAITAFTRAGGAGGVLALPPNLLNMTAANIPFLTFSGSVISAVGLGLVDQATMFQKINSARSPLDAKKAMRGFSFLALILFVMIMIIGLSARVILGEGITGNNVIAELLKQVNPVIGTLYAAAIIAAVLTTANSMYLSASMTFSRDLMQAYNPKIDDKKMMLISKVFIWIVAFSAYFVISYQPSIMRWILLAYTCNTCMVLPLYGGLLSKKATPASGTWSLGLAITAVLVWELLKSPGGVNSVFIALLAGAIGFVIGFVNKKGVTEDQFALVDEFKAIDKS